MQAIQRVSFHHIASAISKVIEHWQRLSGDDQKKNRVGGDAIAGHESEGITTLPTAVNAHNDRKHSHGRTKQTYPKNRPRDRRHSHKPEVGKTTQAAKLSNDPYGKQVQIQIMNLRRRSEIAGGGEIIRVTRFEVRDKA
jgi:hypothetical protein